MGKKILTWVSVLVSMSVLVGGFLAWEKTIAYSSDIFVVREEIRLMNVRYDRKEYRDDLKFKKKRVYQLEQRYIETPMPISVREERQELLMEIDELNRKLYQK